MNCELLDIKHPQLSKLYLHWLDHCEGGKLPSRSQFDVIELQPWLGHLMILKPIEGASDFLYKLHGTALVGIVGEDLTGNYLSNLDGLDRRDHLAKQYRNVCLIGCPAYKHSDSPFEKNYKTINKLILPVADDGVSVNTLIVGVYGEVNWATRDITNARNSFTPLA